jgi:hypothetical protein
MEICNLIRHLFTRSAFPAQVFQPAAPGVKWPGPKLPATFPPEIHSTFAALLPPEESEHGEKAFVFRFVISFHSSPLRLFVIAGRAKARQIRCPAYLAVALHASGDELNAALVCERCQMLPDSIYQIRRVFFSLKHMI